jgi:CheY-like chemotaxis protein
LPLPTPPSPAETTVLLIDDNLDERPRDQTANQLAQWGYSVVVAKSRRSAMSTCAQMTPALIVIGQVKYSSDTSSLLHEIKHWLGESAPSVSFIVQRPGPGTRPILGLAPPIPIDQLLDFSDQALAA